MKKQVYFKNILLIIEMFLLCGAVVAVRTFFPGFVLPRIGIPMLTVLSVIPMMINDICNIGCEEVRPVSLLLAGLTFTLLPLSAGWSAGLPLWKLFVAGTVVYGVTEIVYTSILRRISTGTRVPMAPVVNGFLLWLASQCFQGML